MSPNITMCCFDGCKSPNITTCGKCRQMLVKCRQNITNITMCGKCLPNDVQCRQISPCVALMVVSHQISPHVVNVAKCLSNVAKMSLNITMCGKCRQMTSNVAKYRQISPCVALMVVSHQISPHVVNVAKCFSNVAKYH
ncbi:unnamed protein product [Meganyctiphanes norvegica]|uniref:Uncharacterized protein n=1 Tax=Meganyctiphanes norvegica TaxID=48144 RepID=A0AAV2SLI1_MEGNR